MIDGNENEHYLLEELFKEMKSPGYAHKSELRMRILGTNALFMVFPNMINVTARQYEWDPETTDKANRALTYKLLTGPQRKKVQNWKDFTDLAIRYNHAKLALSKSKRAQINRQIIES